MLEIEVQGATQVRAAMDDSIQIFIAPPDPSVLRDRLAGRGPIRRRRSTNGSKRRKSSSPPRATSTTAIVNDDLDRATEELVAIVRGELADSLD